MVLFHPIPEQQVPPPSPLAPDISDSESVACYPFFGSNILCIDLFRMHALCVCARVR